jgi:hypothetical protein
MLHVNGSRDDLLAKLEAVRLVCRESGCAQRYLAHDALNALHQGTRLADAVHGSERHQRFLAYLDDVQARDLTLGIAMTDAKGDRSARPGQQANRDVHVHIKERRADGIIIRGTKAIVTGAPYVHEFLVMACRTMTAEDADFALHCAVPADAPGVMIVARPAGRPGEAAAKFSAKYGQATGVVVFDDVFVPWDRVFMAGEHVESGYTTTSYATHHRHSCIAARAGYHATKFGQRAYGPNLARITHTELLLAGAWHSASIASSSIVDGGVRIRHGVRLNPAHWIALERPLPPDHEAALIDWFLQHKGKPYDWRGAGGCVMPALVQHNNCAFYCTEGVASAARYEAPHTFCPAAFYLSERALGAIDVTQDFFEGAQ